MTSGGILDTLELRLNQAIDGKLELAELEHVRLRDLRLTTRSWTAASRASSPLGMGDAAAPWALK